jgi:hypothetical protein
VTFPGPTKNGTVRCPHCHHDTGHLPGKPATVTWSAKDETPSVIDIPMRRIQCGWCRATVLIPGEAPDAPPSQPSDSMRALSEAAQRAIVTLAQIPPAMLGPDAMTQNTGPPPHPANCPGDHLVDGRGNIIDCHIETSTSAQKPPGKPAAPPAEPARPTRELIWADDEDWDDW